MHDSDDSQASVRNAAPSNRVRRSHRRSPGRRRRNSADDTDSEPNDVNDDFSSDAEQSAYFPTPSNRRNNNSPGRGGELEEDEELHEKPMTPSFRSILLFFCCLVGGLSLERVHSNGHDTQNQRCRTSPTRSPTPPTPASEVPSRPSAGLSATVTSLPPVLSRRPRLMPMPRPTPKDWATRSRNRSSRLSDPSPETPPWRLRDTATKSRVISSARSKAD
ncbi:hypothetical protein EDD21DRAFT_440663 [Dissophora ornata]|nr:hypothetical protein EDD21DRAFT_440663 [Dissophora ornata]